MTESLKKKIPVCPLLSAGTHDCKICLQEKCGWYVTNTKTCAVYLAGHNFMLDIKEKQQGNKI